MIDPEAAEEALRAGLVVAVPTDTVYGLAVDPTRRGAVKRVFAAKRRPEGIPLPVLVDGVAQLSGIVAAVPAGAQALIERFWPGALTIVLDRHRAFDVDLGDQGSGTVGVRCPDARLVRALCARLGPLAVTSANRHGEVTPASAIEVAAIFGAEVAGVVDGGPCTGTPSTVVDGRGAQIRVLREGRIPSGLIATSV